MRVALDLDGTLVGFVRDTRGEEKLALRPEAIPALADRYFTVAQFGRG